MKHLKKFESFNINETMDMMTLPVDPIPGSLEVWSDIKDAISDNISDITKSIKKIPSIEVDRIKDFLLDTFKTTTTTVNMDNAKILMKALKLDTLDIKEGFKEGENLAVKICGRIKQVLGVNMYAWFGIPMAIVLGAIIAKSGAMVVVLIAASYFLLWLFSKIMEMFGYGGENTDVAGIGDYDSQKDIRNRSADNLKKNYY